MSQVISKLSPIGVTCEKYVHPWTSSCSQATCGLFMYALTDSLRIYSTVYILALIMRGRVPQLEDIKRTLKGIVQSTAFLSFTAFGYSGFLCILRALMGNFNIVTISSLPVFLSSVFAIMIERPSRRTLLALYVSNVATETVWNMLLYRRLVRSIKNGQVAIFAGSIAILLTYFKSGWHKKRDSDRMDSMYNVLKFVLGPHEEWNYVRNLVDRDLVEGQIEREADERQIEARGIHRRVVTSRARARPKNNLYGLIIRLLRVYRRVVDRLKRSKRQATCPHPFSCLFNVLEGGTKMFSVGLALQFSLKFVLNIRTVFKSPTRVFLKRDNLNLAMFLGGSCGLFRASMCLLRHLTGRDDRWQAFPAGLIAGLAFACYPDTTISLYVFWKTLQITYQLGIDAGYLPEVPNFAAFLYCFSTAILFHAALVEPQNLRTSYWKFLHSISGGRVAVMSRDEMNVWGLETSDGLRKVLAKTRTKPVISYFLVK